MAYGTNAPFGLRPTQYLNGSLWTGQYSQYQIDAAPANNIYMGDLVVQLPTGCIGPVSGANAGNFTVPDDTTVLGVFNGCRWIDSQGNPQTSQVWVNGTQVKIGTVPYADIIDDPNVLYDVQTSQFAATDLGAGGVVWGAQLTNMFNNATLCIGGGVLTNGPAGVTIPSNPTTGNNISGNSGYFLNLASAAPVFPTRLLKIVKLTPVPNAAYYPAGVLNYRYGINVSPYCNFNNVLVMINNQVYKGGTGTNGV